MELQTPSGTGSQTAGSFQGALSGQGSAVSGVFRLQQNLPVPTPCVSPTQDIPFSGSVDANNLLTLTSTPFSGSVATLSFPLSLNPVNRSNGTVQITGGACALLNATLFAVYTPNASGTYIGTLTPPQILGQPAVTSSPVTITLSELAADADGRFPTSAIVSYNSPPCMLAGTYTGYTSGSSALLSLQTATSAPPNPPGLVTQPTIVLFLGNTAQGPNILNPNILVPSGIVGCTSGFYPAQLAKQ
jgi:hypothetical protein